MGGSPLPPPHQGQFGLSYQPPLGFPPGRGAVLEERNLPAVIPLVGREGRETGSRSAGDVQQQDTVPHSSPLLAACAAASSLRKHFPLDNVTGVSLPVPGLSLPRLWCVSPGAGTHTCTLGSRRGLCAPLPDHYKSCFCPWCVAQLCSRVYVPADPQRTRPGGRLHGSCCGSTNRPLLPFSPESMLRSASHLLPLDTVV